MTTPQQPPDLFTEKDLEVASILLQVHDLVLKYYDQQAVPFEKVRWGRKRRRTEPPYQFKPQLQRDESGCPTSSDEEKRKQVEEEEDKRASPATPLCFPNSSSSEEKIVTPSVLKQINKPSTHNDRLKEKREQVAALTKEKTDLSREFVELQGKFQMLCAMKLYLKDQHFKLLAQAEMRALNHNIVQQPVGSPQTTSKPQLALQPPMERRRWEINLNEQPTDDLAAYVVDGPLTCESDRAEKAARSAEARKRRMEKQRERRSSSSVHKRTRVS